MELNGEVLRVAANGELPPMAGLVRLLQCLSNMLFTNERLLHPT